jgi:hypothetical protein
MKRASACHEDRAVIDSNFRPGSSSVRYSVIRSPAGLTKVVVPSDATTQTMANVAFMIPVG